MKKLFVNVGASLLFVSLVSLGQASGGAAQAPAAADAVPANLVTTASTATT